MADTLTFEVPADAADRDVRRVRQEVRVARRNTQIEQQYEELKDECPHQEAFRILADRHDCSTRTVRRVVWGG